MNNYADDGMGIFLGILKIPSIGFKATLWVVSCCFAIKDDKLEVICGRYV